MIANIRQLRSSTKEILSAVGRGDTVWVTNHGKPCAKITPADDSSGVKREDEAFGMWKGNKAIGNVRSYIRRIRKWRHAH